MVEWNPGAEKLFGYALEEATGRDLDELIAARDTAMFEQAVGFTQQALGGKSVSPTETVRLGWVNSGFPKRERSAAAPVVIYPRSGPLATAALRRHYRDRRCYYYRVVPQTLTPELRRCADVEPLLARPYQLQGPALAVRSTAMAKGWIDPFRD